MKKINARELLTWAAIVLISGAIAYAVSGGDHGDHGHLEGKPAPALTLARADGQGEVSLEALKGRTVVLNVYATWCPPCRAEFPDFALFADEFTGPDKPVEVFGVVYESGPADKARAESIKLGVSWPVLVGNLPMVQTFDLHTYPTTIVIGPDGVVHRQAEGRVDYNWLRDAVAEASTRR